MQNIFNINSFSYRLCSYNRLHALAHFYFIHPFQLHSTKSNGPEKYLKITKVIFGEKK